jgi:hypothetical protein
MEKAILLLLLSLCAARIDGAAAQQYSTPATATFYGGSDASGTMGKCNTSTPTIISSGQQI